MTQEKGPADFPRSVAKGVRLFPLPNLVMFPGMLQPLHVAEAADCGLVEDALAGDRVIAMALLRPGWESLQELPPPVFPIVCICRLVSTARHDDGSFNVVLQGKYRAELVRESAAPGAWRRADLKTVADHYAVGGDLRRGELLDELLRCCEHLGRAGLFRENGLFPEDDPFRESESPERSLDANSLGVLVDRLASAIDFAVDVKQRLLADADVTSRAEQLLKELRQVVKTGRIDDRPFPPSFSAT